MSFFRITPSQIDTFKEYGFLVVPNLLTHEETGLLGKIARYDPTILENVRDNKTDDKGNLVRLTVFDGLGGDNYYRAIITSERIIRATKQLLDGEVYPYHSKIILKDPGKKGGAWELHQDVGYWRSPKRDNCPRADLLSWYIAIDDATIENGCLSVINSSHKVGPLLHEIIGNQEGIKEGVVRKAMSDFGYIYWPIYVELKPGDAVAFHSQTVHGSGPNNSTYPRWAIIGAYNRTDNPPTNPNYDKRRPMQYNMTPDENVVIIGQKHLETLSQTL